ncbi:ABC-F family ATP-binding cassette domain-containing protein [Bartonella tamiae]|uniref:ABC transporter domain-containing protein n=1 Tax=Bartonella tamiae Th239 TaxID=1094558 RepID=J0R7R3_9HYPH|nr:ATP-binding cassette domain-containing protein [Bartonella tamiae]EJF91774.1 hypothetical protein ME5_00153 [Bartonella tamiae Th239]EJF92558.1 hypothetical protein MEG_01728 [Bartonella tamiae Th307]
MSPPLLHLDHISLTFGGTPLLSNAALSVQVGDRIALVGRNGSGKSTLLKIAAGLMEPTNGEVFRHPSSTIRYLPQAPDMEAFNTVSDYVAAGLGPSDDDYRVSYMLDHLHLDGDANPKNLSGGEARRAALARVIAPQPDILLLDEPTNHLDLTTIEWLESELNQIRSALVIISHDRRFLENVTRSTVWLDRGETKRLEKGFGFFEEWRDKLLEEEEREHHKLGRQIEREEHWLRYGVTARRKRNVRRLGDLQSLRQHYREYRGPQGVAVMEAAEAQDSGKLVIEAKSIHKAYGDRILVDDFSIRIQKGDRIGLVGPNGAGKTTLLSMLTGTLQPDCGMIRLGVNLEMATLDQKRALDERETLAHYLTDGRGDSVIVNGQQRHVVSYMKDFLFQPEQARTPIKELSGGERARLMLARVLSRPANLLILDEPTNDLDMETLDLLQELVSNFPGTVVLVSHDRDFLDRTVTSVVMPEDNGVWLHYAGGYSDMLAQKKQANRLETKVEKSSDKKVHEKNAQNVQVEKQKLSYKQKYALEQLPLEMAALLDEIKRFETEFSDPSLYTRDEKRFHKLSQLLDEKRLLLTKKEEEWLELEMLREEIEGNF